MDSVIGKLVENLKSKNLYDKMNIVLVSDHGMGLIKNESDYIILSEYFNTTNLIDAHKTTYSKISQVYALNTRVENELLTKINQIPNIKAYLKKDVPSRFNYNNNRRIGELNF
jgi:ectonucleotide pyrophosphatase/phosphodiesterase family protein 5